MNHFQYKVKNARVVACIFPELTGNLDDESPWILLCSSIPPDAFSVINNGDLNYPNLFTLQPYSLKYFNMRFIMELAYKSSYSVTVVNLIDALGVTTEQA